MKRKLYLMLLNSLMGIGTPLMSQHQVIFQDDFENGFTWTAKDFISPYTYNTSPNQWRAGSCHSIQGKSAYIGYIPSNSCNPLAGQGEQVIMYQKITATCYKDIQLSFDWKNNPGQGFGQGAVYYSRDSRNWTALGTGGDDGSGHYSRNNTTLHQQYNLTTSGGLVGENFYIGFVYTVSIANNDTDNFIVDNVEVKGLPMKAPSVYAGPDMQLNRGQTIYLNGTASVGEPYFTRDNTTGAGFNNILTPPTYVSRAYSPLPINTNYNGPAKNLFSVTINVTSPTANDLDIYLFAPDGSRVQLVSANLQNIPALQGGGFVNTTFCDTAHQYIAAGKPPYTGSYKPAGRFSGLSGNMNGTWQLLAQHRNLPSVINDDIDSWSISFNNDMTYLWRRNGGILSSSLYTTDAAFMSCIYSLTATDGYGCVVSDPLNLSVVPQARRSTGTGNNSAEIYPNPASHLAYLNVEAEQTGSVKLSVYNILGALIRTSTLQVFAGNNKLEMNTDDLSPGTYNVLVQSVGDTNKNYKLIKQ